MTDFDALWNYGDPEGTEAAFRKVLADEGPGLPEPRKAELLSQIARTLGLQRRFDEAHETLDEAMAFAGEEPIAQARCLLERGRVLNSAGEPDRAMTFFQRALEKAERAPPRSDSPSPDFVAVDAMHMLAIAAPIEEQMKWHLAAMQKARASDDPRTKGWLASLTNNLAWTLHGQGKFEEALRTFEEALALRVAQGKDDLIRIAKWSIARCLRLLGRPAEALERQRELHQECLSAGEADGFGEEEMGECLLALGRKEEARGHFARAFELLSQDAGFVAAEPERIARLRELGSG